MENCTASELEMNETCTKIVIGAWKGETLVEFSSILWNWGEILKLWWNLEIVVKYWNCGACKLWFILRFNCFQSSTTSIFHPDYFTIKDIEFVQTQISEMQLKNGNYFIEVFSVSCSWLALRTFNNDITGVGVIT